MCSLNKGKSLNFVGVSYALDELKLHVYMLLIKYTMSELLTYRDTK